MCFQNVDQAMAQTKCQITLDRLEWLDELDSQSHGILEAKEEMLEGVLRNNRGTVSLTSIDQVFSLLFLTRLYQVKMRIILS